MNNKNKFWAALFAIIAALSAGIYIYTGSVSYKSVTASIYSQGELVEKIDLAQVTSSYDITIESEAGGVNTVYVEPGRISISHASCPDQICVEHAPIENGVEPIVCLPNKVIVQIESSDTDIADAVAGG